MRVRVREGWIGTILPNPLYREDALGGVTDGEFQFGYDFID